jgi:hypothetical protein
MKVWACMMCVCVCASVVCVRKCVFDSVCLSARDVMNDFTSHSLCSRISVHVKCSHRVLMSKHGDYLVQFTHRGPILQEQVAHRKVA